jgi:hypothetical protein
MYKFFDHYILSVLNSNGEWEVWLTDGTPSGTLPLKTIGASSVSTPFTGFYEAGGFAVFSFRNTSLDVDLWITDGSSGGTFKVQNLDTSGSAFRNNYTHINGKILFGAIDQTSDRMIWVSDGSNTGTFSLEILLPELVGPYESRFGVIEISGLGGFIFG